ncbi:MAG: type II secretion system secretin GspD [Steroidobacteraceae bacterium]|nr:type II secretion system secretin GspD [Nevskiaceae bacterium]MCP5340322.1 type II secretion system secretin GspD [Nevskiaceae bacterium]MCP5359693.1 type II secretion system secretin GspD [Nevskiaceae bacterium]
MTTSLLRRLLPAARAGLVVGLLALTAPPSPAQQAALGTSAQRITPSFKDADITQVIEAVGAATGRNIIIDPRVRAQVTMLSSTPMSPEAFYEAFLALLQVHGFVAVPSGNVTKIIPDANARQVPGNDLPGRVSATSDEIVTQVVAVRNISAAQLVPILRPLIPQYGHLAAYPSANILIISDRANNVNRMLRIIQRIDQASDADIEIVALQNASAAEVVRTMTALSQGQAQAEGGAPQMRVVADDRSNSILISGEKSQRLKAKTLVAYLDTPLANGGDTRVRYLRYADAEKIAAKLKEQISGVSAAAPAAQGAQAIADKSTVIWAEPETNALVITAPPKTMSSLMSVIDSLDIRRAQVLVEAIIVEVTADKSAELGVNWVIDGSRSDNPIGGFVEPVGGISIIDLYRASQDSSTLTTVPRGLTVGGVGRLSANGINFGAVLRALRGDSDTNIIATPSIVTMDNQEAQIKVAQEVPFITGQYTSTGASNGATNPFQTITRQEVGTILKITPQINQGDAVMLKIEQESSSIAGTSSGAVDLITNKRTINTNVLIEDGGTIVLGGLIQDTQTRGEQRVPFLGRIPIVGEAFRTRSAKNNKTNLMVFIQPRILRDGIAAGYETNEKYNYIRDQQRRIGPRGEVLPLLPGTKRQVLPELPPPVPTSAPTPVPAGDTTTTAPDTTR